MWTRAQSPRPTQGEDFFRVGWAAHVYVGRLSWRAGAGTEGERWCRQHVGHGRELFGQRRVPGSPALSYLGPAGRLKLGLS